MRQHKGGMVRKREENSVHRVVSSAMDWRRSTFCESGACVEVASLDGMIALRDSGGPNGPIIWCDPIGWRSFIKRAKNGDFDDLI